MKARIILIMSIIALMPFSILAQGNSSFNEYKSKKQQEFNNYKEKRRKEFEEYRRKRNEEFAEFMRKTWDNVNPRPITPTPKDETIPPVVVPIDDPTPIKQDSNPILFEEVIPSPKPIPQPQPIDPIDEIPVSPIMPVQHTTGFTFFGTEAEVRFDNKNILKFTTLDENTVADAWLKLSEETYTNLIHDCLELRKKYELCDWAYIMMLHHMSESIFGVGSNESTLLMAYVYCQSGYQMRLAIDGQQLHLLVSSKHHIFGLPYFELDGKNYYPFLCNGQKINDRVQICSVSYPNEKPMSLLVPSAQRFAVNFGKQRTIKSERYPDAFAKIKTNKNLMSFYSTYPTSMIDDNIMTRWAMYANTPMAGDVSAQLYPQLRSVLEGKSESEAVNILLNWVQTGFEYEFDDKVWGGDRAFFAEESLNYPYCDCEDRSILFTRLVRDILGLKCILVFYPGHLATAVCFNEAVNGDYIQLNNKQYTVCDPTYIGAPVGLTMPDMNNQTAKVILLN